MSGQFFISLLNPGVGLILAIAFYFLWLHRSESTYTLLAAAGYLSSALGFLIQDVLPGLPWQLHRMPSNLFFMLTGVFVCAAILSRFRIAVPYGPMAALVAAGMAAQSWFLFVQPDLPARIQVISACAGIMLAFTAVKLYQAPKPHTLDRLLFVFVVVVAANNIVRGLGAFRSRAELLPFDGLEATSYWATVQFSQAMLSLVLALALMVSVALELIGELKHEADTDKLSGLLNRRGFEERAGAALGDCASSGSPVALLVADLDHFKAINDTCGHSIGDRVIGAFGSLIRRSAGADTIAGRIGGEEFAVLMPGTGLPAAMAYAERIRYQLARDCRAILPVTLSPSVSIGVCVAAPGADLHALLRDADDALYQAKKAGRNRVQAFAPGTCPPPPDALSA